MAHPDMMVSGSYLTQLLLGGGIAYLWRTAGETKRTQKDIIKSQGDEIQALKVKAAVMETQLASHAGDISEIKTDVKYIREHMATRTS